MGCRINIDAALIKKTHQVTKTNEKIIALQNGCICCTLRGDLLEELVRLAQLQEFDYIIIESSGISEPEQVAETFDARLAEHMGDMAAAPGALELDENMVKVLKQLFVTLSSTARRLIANVACVTGSKLADWKSLPGLTRPSQSSTHSP